MQIPRHNQQLVFTLAAILVLGVVVGYLLERGVGELGDRERVLALADQLAKVKTQQDYLALLRTNYPDKRQLWDPKAAPPADAQTSAALFVQPNGQIKVVVFSITAENMLDPLSYMYLPAALVDDADRGYRLEDVRINSFKTSLVFEYIFAPATAAAPFPRRFSFFRAQKAWHLEPAISKTP